MESRDTASEEAGAGTIGPRPSRRANPDGVPAAAEDGSDRSTGIRGAGASATRLLPGWPNTAGRTAEAGAGAAKAATNEWLV